MSARTISSRPYLGLFRPHVELSRCTYIFFPAFFIVDRTHLPGATSCCSRLHVSSGMHPLAIESVQVHASTCFLEEYFWQTKQRYVGIVSTVVGTATIFAR